MLFHLKSYGAFRTPLADTTNRPIPVFDHDCEGGLTVVHFLGASLFSRGTWLDELGVSLNNEAQQKEQPSPVDTKRYKVAVTALAGRNSDWGVRQLQNIFGPDRQTPDLLVVGFSANDAALHRGVPLKKSRQNHQQIIAYAQEFDTPVFLATLAPAFGPRKWVRPGLHAYKDLYHELADENDNTEVIDTLPIWQTLPETELKASIPDGLHPSDEAMRSKMQPFFRDTILGKNTCPGS